MNNHLGNVRAVVSDRRGLSTITESGGVFTIENEPELVAWTDYYPFGMRKDGRNYRTSDYRYSFQGQEHDDEVKGEGNGINYKYRMHDPRIGRFFAVDPLAAKYPHNSTYAFSENTVIDHVELEGLEKADPETEETWDLGQENVTASGIDEGTHEGATYDASGAYKMGKIDGNNVRLYPITSGPNKGNYVGTAYYEDGSYEYNRYLVTGASINENSPFFNLSSTESSPTLDFVKFYNSLDPYLVESGEPFNYSQLGALGRNDHYKVTAHLFAKSAWNADGMPGISFSQTFETEHTGYSNAGNPMILSLLAPGPKIQLSGRVLVLGIDATTMYNFAKLSGSKGAFTVLAHGATDWFIVNGKRRSVETVFRKMTMSGYKKGTKITLVSCSTGKYADGVAQKLANMSGGVVTAPTDLIRVVGGTTFEIMNGGVMKTFYPQ